MKKLLFCILAVSALTLPSFSAVIPINCDANDQGIRVAGAFWVGQGDSRVGFGSTEASIHVLAFELPTLAAGETVVGADLAFTITGGSNWNSLFEHGIDLYALRLSSAADPSTADFYHGAYGANPNGTGIQQNIVYEAEKLNQAAPGQMGRIDTSTTAEAALGAWIQSMYESAEYNASGSNFVILSLNPDESFSSTYRYWSVATANNATEADRPVLTLSTVIPEPATMCLLAIGGLALLRRRK